MLSEQNKRVAGREISCSPDGANRNAIRSCTNCGSPGSLCGSRTRRSFAENMSTSATSRMRRSTEKSACCTLSLIPAPKGTGRRNPACRNTSIAVISSSGSLSLRGGCTAFANGRVSSRTAACSPSSDRPSGTTTTETCVPPINWSSLFHHPVGLTKPLFSSVHTDPPVPAIRSSSGRRLRPAPQGVFLFAFPTTRMKWLFRRMRKSTYPRWFSDHVRGNLRARIGQDLNPNGEPEIVVQFHVRENYGNWKTAGTFRYLDAPYLNVLLKDVHDYVSSLITHG